MNNDISPVDQMTLGTLFQIARDIKMVRDIFKDENGKNVPFTHLPIKVQMWIKQQISLIKGLAHDLPDSMGIVSVMAIFSVKVLEKQIEKSEREEMQAGMDAFLKDLQEQNAADQVDT